MSAQLPLALPVGPDQRFELFVGHDWAVEVLRAAATGKRVDASIDAGLFVEGVEGSGKSHLLLAACREAHEAGRLARARAHRSGGDAGLGQGVEKGGLADVGQADDAALETHGIPRKINPKVYAMVPLAVG
jgi:hypothetical protein